MIKTFELGWYKYQVKQEGRESFFRLYRRDSGLHTKWFNLSKVDFIKITPNEIAFKHGWLSYHICFTGCAPGLYKTTLTSKLFNTLPYFKYRGEISESDKNELYGTFNKYS